MSLKTSSIIRKVSMALSGLFLVVFLTQNFTINLTSVFSENIFNEISHFMGNNFIVQFIFQPILIFGVVFHFVMGFILEYSNNDNFKLITSFSELSCHNCSFWIISDKKGDSFYNVRV